MNGTPESPCPAAPQDAILDAAATVFAEHGFAGARVEAIARAAGLNKAMLYYRVGDKALLYELVLTRQFGRLADAVEAIAAKDSAGVGSVLQAVLDALADLFVADPRLPRIMAWELASGGKNLPVAVFETWKRIAGTVTALAGRAGLDPALTHFALVGPLVFTCLTEPVRKRLSGEVPPELRRFTEFGVKDMAAHLGTLYRNAAREEA